MEINLSHTVEGVTIDYKLVYKKRKTLGIYIDVYGNIEVRIPTKTDIEQVTALIENKWQWIVSHQSEMKEKTKGFKERSYEDGEAIELFGERFQREIVVNEEVKKATLTFDYKVITITAPEYDKELFKKLMTRFYKQQCKKMVEKRIKHYQPLFKTKPRSVKISSNKKHWGTCNNHYELTFNWKLAMAPIDVLDYVVIHEMCHMVHLNHDRSFWRLVGKYMPDYKEKQDWLSTSHWKMVV